MPGNLPVMDAATLRDLQAVIRRRYRGANGIHVQISADGTMVTISGEREPGGPPPSASVRDANILSVSGSAGSWVYTIELGFWNMSSAASAGGTWVPAAGAARYTAFAEDPAAATALSTGYCQVRARGVDGAGSGYFTIIAGSGGALTVSGKVTGNASGNGKYTGKSFTDVTSDVSASGNLAEADFGTLAGSDDCLVLNPVELGVSNTGHDVTAATNTAQFSVYFTGRLVRVNSDGKKVVHAQLFFVGC